MHHGDIFEELFVLELANNHWGDVDRGLEIIRQHSRIVRFNNVRAAIKLQFRDVEKRFPRADRPSIYQENNGYPNVERKTTHTQETRIRISRDPFAEGPDLERRIDIRRDIAKGGAQG